MGFARTRDVLQVGRGMKFVSRWAIDREREVYFIPTGLGGYEIHWRNNVIAIKETHKETLRKQAQKFDQDCIIKQLIIPRTLEGKNDIFAIIISLVDELFKFYCNRNIKHKVNITVNFSPDFEIRYQEHVKSRVKLSVFATIQ